MNKVQIEFNKKITSLRKQSRLKSCIWGGEDKQGCNGKIIAAHSIQRGKILERIAENGKVCFLNVVPSEDVSEMNGVFDLEGIKKFSTFSGFCGEHDKVVFQPIEDRAYVGEEHQKNIYAYRAAAKELHNNKESVALMKELLGDALNEPDSPPHMKMFLPQILSGEMIVPDFILKEMLKGAVNDFGRAKYRNTILTVDELSLVCDSLKEVLGGEVSSMLKHHIYTFDNVYPIACNSAFIPYFDYSGGKLFSDEEMISISKEKIENVSDCSTVFLNIFPENEKTHVIFSHFDKSNRFGESINELFSKSENEIKLSLSNMLFNYVENIAMNPSYLKGMFTSSQRELMLKGFRENILDANSFSKVNINLFKK